MDRQQQQLQQQVRRETYLSSPYLRPRIDIGPNQLSGRLAHGELTRHLGFMYGILSWIVVETGRFGGEGG